MDNLNNLQVKDYGRKLDQVSEPELQEKWDTKELGENFIVHGFSAPFVIVTRISDNKRGSLEFTHSPRVYFNFKEG